ncbi:RHS repeat domain-containing protein [Streptomyces sp. NPDC048420]|uniref:RHS repeat domain-containing protein n=1 Tax=Streptomyces sp. NPDC048420 TaxID=3155755 RepID=UPI003421589E
MGLRATKEVPAVTCYTGYTGAADRTTAYTYDERGRLVTQTDPGGVTVTSHYDALDDLTAQTGTGAATADRHFAYSLIGHLFASAFGGTWEYYDTDGRLTTDTLSTSADGTVAKVAYDWDENGNLACSPARTRRSP